MSLRLLLSECIDDIFPFLLNSRTLYKCLFVNRYWCRLFMPIIWRDPFGITTNRAPLANTLIACLNEDEISSLIPCIINVNIQSPLFEYGKFIRTIEHGELITAIETWLNYSNLSSIEVDCRVSKLSNVIYHMIMRQGSGLQRLELYVYEDDFHIDLPKFSIFTTFIPGITNLRSLVLGVIVIELSNNIYQNIIEFLSMVPKFCDGIVSCELELFIGSAREFIKPIFDILVSQPLERIKLEISCDKDYDGWDVEKFLHALEFRSETLKELSLKSLNFQGTDSSFISKLGNLKYLKLRNCCGFTSKHFQTLSEMKLNLKGLNLVYTESNIMKSLINSLCGEILLEMSLSMINHGIAKILKQSCPNINFLHIDITTHFSESAIPIICKLSSLKIMHITSLTDVPIDTDLFVETLGRHLEFVEDLSIGFRVDSLSFEYFIKNCKAKLKKLGLHIWEFPKSYLTCLDYYQKEHNSLKVLEIVGRINEKLEIYNSLKNRGVNIVKVTYLFRDEIKVLKL